jgi:hypothetical protein
MNLGKLERKLLAAAKANPPSDAVPYAFEQRIMARLGRVPAVDQWAAWAGALWRAAAPCVAIAIVIGVWTTLAPAGNAAGATDLSQQLENTLLVSVTQEPASLDSNSTW